MGTGIGGAWAGGRQHGLGAQPHAIRCPTCSRATSIATGNARSRKGGANPGTPWPGQTFPFRTCPGMRCAGRRCRQDRRRGLQPTITCRARADPPRPARLRRRLRYLRLRVRRVCPGPGSLAMARGLHHRTLRDHRAATGRGSTASRTAEGGQRHRRRRRHGCGVLHGVRLEGRAGRWILHRCLGRAGRRTALGRHPQRGAHRRRWAASSTCPCMRGTRSRGPALVFASCDAPGRTRQRLMQGPRNRPSCRSGQARWTAGRVRSYSRSERLAVDADGRRLHASTGACAKGELGRRPSKRGSPLFQTCITTRRVAIVKPTGSRVTSSIHLRSSKSTGTFSLLFAEWPDTFRPRRGGKRTLAPVIIPCRESASWKEGIWQTATTVARRSFR